MCGIVGIFGNLRKEDLERSINKMSATLTHRGNDDAGIWIDEENYYKTMSKCVYTYVKFLA